MKSLLVALLLSQTDGGVDAPRRGWVATDTQVCVDQDTFQKHMAKDQELEASKTTASFPVVWALIGLIIGGVSTYAVVKAGGAK